MFSSRHVDIGEAVLVDVAHLLRLGLLGDQDDLALIWQKFAISFANLLVVHPSAISAVKWAVWEEPAIFQEYNPTVLSRNDTVFPADIHVIEDNPILF